MILIDMQGYQSFSKKRGIGRYTLNFVKAFLKQKEAFLLFNKNFKDIEEDKKEFLDLVGAEKIIEFSSSKKDLWMEKASELLREKLIQDLNPKAILVTSLFEGLYDTSITSIKKFYNIPTAVIFYDLIPLIQKEMFFQNKLFKEWYLEKLDNLKRADLLLAISESSKEEALKYLNFDENKTINISSAVNISHKKDDFNKLKEKFNIKKDYIIHVSACDERKNFEGLIKAFSKTKIKNSYQLVFICNANQLQKTKLYSLAKTNGVDLIITGYVSDEELHSLYENAKLLVFPSFHEGFGLPILEAMEFDTPAIGSNTTSIPEVIGYKEALFNPYDIDDMANKIEEVLTTNLYDKLKEHIKTQKEKFSWDITAKRAIEAIEKIESIEEIERIEKIENKNIFENTDRLIKEIVKLGDTSDTNLKKIAIMIEKNEIEVLKKRIKTIRIEGPFDSSYSLALLNRETAKALKKLGYEVSLYSTEGFGDFEPNKEYLDKHPEIKELWTKEKKDVDLVSRNLYPPRTDEMVGKIKMFHHYAWEESGFVDEWANGFNNNLNCLSTLSSHVTKIMIDNGVYVPMQVSGCGVDHFNQIEAQEFKIENPKTFKFLHISSCFPRKGVDILLDAYEMAFNKNDDVSLIIKTFPNPHNNIEELLKEKREKNKNFPHVILINKDIDEKNLKWLYKISDVLVAPSRAEGFGLPAAEAMLEKVGVIVTNWGGWLDFCNEENSWLVDFKFSKAKTHFDLINSVWAEVDKDDLAKKMKLAFNTPKEEIIKKSQKGIDLLNKNFKWTDVAKRMINSAISYKETKNPKVGWVSTWEVKCGIATYSKHLIEHFENKPIIFSTYDSKDENSIKCWNTSDKNIKLDNLYNEVIKNNIEVLFIQFNYSFFDFKHFNTLIDKLHKKVKIIIELHSTYDHPLIPEKKLEMIDFSKVDRVIVHNIDDLNRLKELGYIENVMLFSHGILDFESNIKPKKDLIATYGFFLPHKGLIETIKAMKILKEKGANYKLKMINSQYPADVSKNLINEAKQLIKDLNLEKDIELNTEFLDDKTCLEEISKAKVVVFPYQETGESASGAVRYALAANRDILVTPIKIFDDVKKCGFTIKGFSSQDIADGIIEYFNKSNNELKQVKEYREKWLDAHRYSKLSKKLENIIKSVYINL